MKIKRLIAALLAFAALFAVSPAVAAQSGVPTANARVGSAYTDFAPVADGVVSAGEYGAPVVSYRPGDIGSGVIAALDDYGDWGFDFYTVWDENALYLAWEVFSDVFAPIPDSVVNAYGGGLGHMWEYSCVQCMVTPGAPALGSTAYQAEPFRGNYYEAGICLRENGSTAFTEWCLPENVFSSGTASGKALHDSEKGVAVYELRLPWSSLGCEVVGNGIKIGLAFAVAAQDDFNVKRGMLEWQDAILDGKSVDSAAVLTLSGDPSPYKPQPLWLTHYNDPSVEGAGVIFTEADTAGDWWNHAAFAPVEGEENVFEIVEICSGTDGHAYRLEVPEGGFVYAVNVGNNWPALTEGMTGDGSSGVWYDDEEHVNMPNYVNAGSVEMTYRMIREWQAGLRFSFEGIDLKSFTVPTSTPETPWYSRDYVCTASITKQLVSDQPEDHGGGPEGPDDPAAFADFTFLPANASGWKHIDHNGASASVSPDPNGFKITGGADGTWPSVYHLLEEPVSVPVSGGGRINFRFTVLDGRANINFILLDNNGEMRFVDASGTVVGDPTVYSISNTPFVYYASNCVGDVRPGFYSGSFTLAELAESSSKDGSVQFSRDYVRDGRVTFAGIQVFSVDGAKVFIERLDVSGAENTGAGFVSLAPLEMLKYCDLLYGTDGNGNETFEGVGDFYAGELIKVYLSGNDMLSSETFGEVTSLSGVKYTAVLDFGDEKPFVPGEYTPKFVLTDSKGNTVFEAVQHVRVTDPGIKSIEFRPVTVRAQSDDGMFESIREAITLFEIKNAVQYTVIFNDGTKKEGKGSYVEYNGKKYGITLEDDGKTHFKPGRYTFKASVLGVSAELQVTVTGDFVFGDVNGDGNINGLDYAMVKRHVLGTYTISGAALDAADVNGDGNVDGLDYAMIKRHVLGTYIIE